MKKKLKWIVPSVLSVFGVLLIACYFSMTAMGALRFAIITSGHPVAAFTFKTMATPYYTYAEANKTGYSLENPPFEADTQSELVNWAVTKHGVFYTAYYEGWG
ncbi:MAG: hypothetical protein PHO10_04040 [Gemmiger sp.]|nr:hypothetical protein [Gemmiger sp.]